MGSFRIGDLPLHPLLVHGVVVLIPLTALALVLHAAWPAARRRLGVVTPLAALLVLVLVPITVEAGESLKRTLGSSPAIERHEGRADTLLPWVIAMFVVAVALWVWHRFGVSGGWVASAGARSAIGLVLVVLAAGVAVGSVIDVVRIGDSGARAVWGGLFRIG